MEKEEHVRKKKFSLLDFLHISSTETAADYRPFLKKHNTLFCPSKICMDIILNFSWNLRQTGNNAYAKFWRNEKEY